MEVVLFDNVITLLSVADCRSLLSISHTDSGIHTHLLYLRLLGFLPIRPLLTVSEMETVLLKTLCLVIWLVIDWCQ